RAHSSRHLRTYGPTPGDAGLDRHARNAHIPAAVGWRVPSTAWAGGPRAGFPCRLRGKAHARVAGQGRGLGPGPVAVAARLVRVDAVDLPRALGDARLAGTDPSPALRLSARL